MRKQVNNCFGFTIRVYILVDEVSFQNSKAQRVMAQIYTICVSVCPGNHNQKINKNVLRFSGWKCFEVPSRRSKDKSCLKDGTSTQAIENSNNKKKNPHQDIHKSLSVCFLIKVGGLRLLNTLIAK